MKNERNEWRYAGEISDEWNEKSASFENLRKMFRPFPSWLQICGVKLQWWNKEHDERRMVLLSYPSLFRVREMVKNLETLSCLSTNQMFIKREARAWIKGELNEGLMRDQWRESLWNEAWEGWEGKVSRKSEECFSLSLSLHISLRRLWITSRVSAYLVGLKGERRRESRIEQT